MKAMKRRTMFIGVSMREKCVETNRRPPIADTGLSAPGVLAKPRRATDASIFVRVRESVVACSSRPNTRCFG